MQSIVAVHNVRNCGINSINSGINSKATITKRYLSRTHTRAGKWLRKKLGFKAFFKNLKTSNLGFLGFLIFWSNFIQIILNFIF